MSHLKRFTIFFSKEINVRQTSLYLIYVDDEDDNKIQGVQGKETFRKLRFWTDMEPCLDKVLCPGISIVIWILSSDTETSAATPLGAGPRKVLAK